MPMKSIKTRSSCVHPFPSATSVVLCYSQCGGGAVLQCLAAETNFFEREYAKEVKKGRLFGVREARGFNVADNMLMCGTVTCRASL